MSRFAALNDPGLVFVVDDVLDADACAATIARVEALEPRLTTDGTPRGTIRHNFRAIENDAVLAEHIYRKVLAHVPPRLIDCVPCGANECIRFYRYGPGDYFKPHQDTDFQRSPVERSLLSCVVYLNDGYEGGALGLPTQGRVLQPRAGSAVVFGHRVVHESTLLVRGTKYALRTDIMYRAA